MDSFNPTTKTQQAISAAAQAATLAGNPDVGPTHLLGALLAQGDGIAAPLLAAVGADAASVRAELTQLGNRLPSAAGSSVSAPHLNREGLAAITAAQQLATEMGDEYVSTESGSRTRAARSRRCCGGTGPPRRRCARPSPRCAAPRG
jgi:ATP-dependent Clp protease ATP-binding subunit ClpB